MDFVKQQMVRMWSPRKNHFLIIPGMPVVLAVLSLTPSALFARATSSVPSTATHDWKTAFP